MSAGKIIRQLLLENGPMTTNALANYIPKHPQELISKSHLKRKILLPMKEQGALVKKIHRQPAELKSITEAEKSRKEVFVWMLPEQLPNKTS